MSEPILSLLLVDDEDSVREPLARHLRAEPYKYEVKDVADFEGALQALEETKGRFDVALIDEVLKESPGGLDLLRQIKTQYPQIECILFTGWGMQSGLEALRAGTYRYFAKPFNLEELALTIRFAADKKRIHREREYLSTLVQISRELTQTADLDKQLALVWNFVQERLATATFFIALYDSKTDILSFPLSFDEGKPDPLPDRYLGDDPSGWGVAGHVVKNRQEQVWFSLKQSEKEWQALGILPQISGKGPSETGICIPLQVGEKILGVLSVQSYQPHAFDLAFLDAVRTLGGQVAPAIENARLFSKLERTSNHLESLIASSLDAVISIDGRKRITVYNKRAEEMFGYTADEMIGQNVAILHQDIGEAVRIWNVVHSQGKIAHYEVTLKHKNGTKIPTILSAMSIKDTGGSEIGQAGFLHARLVEDQLRALIQASQAISGTLEPDKVLHRIIESAITAFSTAEKGAIHLYDERTGVLVMKAYKGYSLEVAKAVTFKPGEGRSGWVYEHNEPLVVANVQENEISKQVDSKIAHKEVSEQKSTICVPLRIKGKVIGTLSLDNVTFYDAFHNSDIELLSTFADQAAIAIDNSLRMQELEYMQKATAALAGVLEPHQVLQQIAESASEVLRADSTAVWSFDNVSNQTIPEELVAYGIPKDQLERFRKQEPKQGGTAETVIERAWVGVADISDPEYAFMGTSTVELLNSIGARSFEGIALKVGNENLGVLYVNYNRPRDFTQEDRRRLETFANHAAIALKKTRLTNQVKIARDAASVIAQIVALEKDIQETWDSIVAGTKEALPCDAVVLYRYNEDSGELGYPPAMAGVNYPEKATLLPSVPERSIVWKVLRSDDLLIVNDATSDPLTSNRRFTIEEGTKSLVGIPLKAGDQRVGVMFVNYRNKHRFTQDELTHINLFANQITVAIRNAQLLERTTKQAETLEGLYEAGKAVTGLLDLNKILERIVEQAWRLVGRPASYTSIKLVENETAKAVATYPPEELAQLRATILEIDLRTGVNGRFGITGRAIRTGKSQLVDDVSTDNDYLSTHLETLSELATPIKLGEQVIGVINVESPEPRVFTENDEHTLESLASYAAIAINNAQLFEEQNRARTASRVVAELAVLGDLNKTLESIVSGAKEVLRCDVVTLYTYDKETDEFNFPPAMAGVDEQTKVLMLGEVAKHSVVQRILELEKIHEAEDASSDLIMRGPFVSREKIKSSVGIPLRVGDRKVGVMFVNYRSHHRFTTDESANIELFANQAAVAIRNAQLYRTNQQYTKTLVAIQATSSAVSAILELDFLLPMITDKAAEIFNAPATSLMMWDKSNENLVIRAAFGLSDEYRQGQQIARSVVDKIVAKRGLGPHVININQEPIGDPKLVKTEGLYTVLVAPFAIGNEIIGILNIYSKDKSRQFKDTEKELATIFANHATIAIQNAHSYKELKNTKGLVGARTALAWTGMISSTWRHTIEKHAITIREQIELLRGDLTKLPKNDSIEKRLEMMERLANQILKKPLTAPLSAEEEVSSVLVNDFIKERVHQLWVHQPYKDVGVETHLELENFVSVRASIEWLRRAMDILVDNAVDAMAKLPGRKIIISTRKADRRAEILIRDNGRGIPKEIQEHLFLGPIAKSKDAKGLGMGLLFAQMIVQTYGGEIRVEETGAKGTILVISLPLET